MVISITMENTIENNERIFELEKVVETFNNREFYLYGVDLQFWLLNNMSVEESMELAVEKVIGVRKMASTLTFRY